MLPWALFCRANLPGFNSVLDRVSECRMIESRGGHGRRVAFSFLEDIKNKFVTTYGEKGRTALAYAMNEEFSRILGKQVTTAHSTSATTSISASPALSWQC